MANQSTNSGMGFLSILLLIFITLKLCGVIAWSWWWVMAPFWIPLSLGLLIIGICLFMAVVTGQTRPRW